jgi:nucleoside 2-deoxyribosyltransferase
MFEHLAYLDYLKRKENKGFVITPKGFERAEQLMATNIDSKTVFVAMQFSNDLIEACEKAIKPACLACGFDAFLIKEKPHNNGITDEIIVEIKKSKFVIVDFTYNNNGAYWEAGYAQGLGRTVIRCCKKEWFDSEGKKLKKDNPLHFDIKHYNTILWESYEHLIKELKDNIRANIEGAILVDIDENELDLIK